MPKDYYRAIKSNIVISKNNIINLNKYPKIKNYSFQLGYKN